MSALEHWEVAPDAEPVNYSELPTVVNAVFRIRPKVQIPQDVPEDLGQVIPSGTPLSGPGIRPLQSSSDEPLAMYRHPSLRGGDLYLRAPRDLSPEAQEVWLSLAAEDYVGMRGLPGEEQRRRWVELREAAVAVLEVAS